MADVAPRGLYLRRLVVALEVVDHRLESLADQVVYHLARHDEAHRQGRHGTANFQMGLAAGLRLARTQLLEDREAIDSVLNAP